MSAAAAWVAAWLQALAYLIYLRGALRRRIDPNPTSWLMWAYGTALVVVLEADQGIEPSLRALPVVCAACSVLIAALCWRRGELRWPSAGADRLALAVDLGATAVYVAVSGAAGLAWMSAGDAWLAKAVLLVCVATSTLVSYAPMLRATRVDPSGEQWLPWAVWTLAYALLLGATAAREGAGWAALQFWVYPAICMLSTAWVGWYALGARTAGAGRVPRVSGW